MKLNKPYSSIYRAVQAALPDLMQWFRTRPQTQQQAIAEAVEPSLPVDYATHAEEAANCLKLWQAALKLYFWDLRNACTIHKSDQHRVRADFESADSPQLAALLEPIGADIAIFKAAMRRKLAADVEAYHVRRAERQRKEAEQLAALDAEA